MHGAGMHSSLHFDPARRFGSCGLQRYPQAERFMFIGTQCNLWGKPDGTGHEKNKSRELPGGRKTVKSKMVKTLCFQGAA